jgi:excisionase family DNA binding protein
MTLTTDEAAERIGVKPATIRQWVVRGELEPVRRGAKPLRFHEADVVETQLRLRPDTWRRRMDGLATRWSEAVSLRSADVVSQ